MSALSCGHVLLGVFVNPLNSDSQESTCDCECHYTRSECCEACAPERHDHKCSGRKGCISCHTKLIEDYERLREAFAGAVLRATVLENSLREINLATNNALAVTEKGAPDETNVVFCAKCGPGVTIHPLEVEAHERKWHP